MSQLPKKNVADSFSKNVATGGERGCQKVAPRKYGE
jgi:hypothetical protein